MEGIQPALLVSACAVIIALLGYAAGRAKAHREEGAETERLRAEDKRLEAKIEGVAREFLDKLAVQHAETRAAVAEVELAEERKQRQQLETEVARLRGGGGTRP